MCLDCCGGLFASIAKSIQLACGLMVLDRVLGGFKQQV